MSSQQIIITYIEKTRKAGYTETQIRDTLKKAGWNDKDIDEAMSNNIKVHASDKTSIDSQAPVAHDRSLLQVNGKRISTLAIAAMIFAFFAPLIGLILGIVAIGQIKKTGEKGKGFAIAAIVLSIIYILISFITVIVLVVSPLLMLKNSISEGVEETANLNEIIRCATDVTVHIIQVGSEDKICLSKNGNEGTFAILLENTGLKDISDFKLEVISDTIYTKEGEIGTLGKQEIKGFKLNIANIEGTISKIVLSPKILGGSTNPEVTCSEPTLQWDETEITSFPDCETVTWDDKI